MMTEAETRPTEPTHMLIRDGRGVVFGDHNAIHQYFLDARYRPLAEHLISFDDLIAERTSEFVGREFVDEALAEFLATHDRGYFVLVGEPGIGKTAWAAHTVVERQALHHFNVAAMGIVRPEQALENLCAQIIARAKLERTYLPVTTGRDGALLKAALREAAERLTGEQLILVIDALDEVQMQVEMQDSNVLYLPASLPQGVYIVATRRPQEVTLATEAGTAMKTFTLYAATPENEADVQQFLEQQAGKAEIAQRLAARGISARQFVKAMLSRSAGNFMYLAYVLPDIAAGRFDPLDLGALPTGLDGYYERFWRELERAKGEGRQDWLWLYKPVIGLLTAAQEPVTAKWLVRMTGLGEEEVTDFALARWRKFLFPTGTGKKAAWRVYHTSLREYLTAKLDSAKRYHGIIADHYLAAGDGDWNKLAEIDGGYGLRYLAVHLARTERWEELHELVAEGSGEKQAWAEAKRRMDGHYAEYVADVHLAWRRDIEQVTESSSEEGQEAALARFVRYALIVASINSLAGNYEPVLVGRAVETGLWTAAQGIAVAQQVPDAGRRAEVYRRVLIAGRLKEQERSEAEEQGLAAVRAIESQRARACALSALAPQLTGELVEEGLKAANAIHDEGIRMRVLSALAPRLMGELMAQGLAMAQAIGHDWARTRALAALAQQLTGEMRERITTEALAVAHAIKWEGDRADALAALVPYLTGELKERTLAHGLGAAQAIRDEGARARALATLAPHLTGEMRERALVQGLTAARAICDKKARADALTTFGSQLTGRLRDMALEQCLAVAQTIEDAETRACTLAALAPHLTGKKRGKALAKGLTAAQTVKDDGARARALAALNPRLADDFVAQKLAAMPSIRDEEARAHVMAVLAPRLTGELREQALAHGLAVAQAIRDDGTRVYALAMLATKLTGEMREQALAQGLASAEGIEDQEDRAHALATLAPLLTGELVEQGLAAVWEIADQDDRVHVLAAFAPQLSGELVVEGLTAVVEIEDEDDRVSLLKALVSHLTGELQGDVLRKVLWAVQKIVDENARVSLLEALVPHLAGELQGDVLWEILWAVEEIKDEDKRVSLLEALAPHLTGELDVEDLAALVDFEAEWARVRALSALTPHLTGKLSVEDLAALVDFEDEWVRAHALSALAPHLTGKLSVEDLAAFLDFEVEDLAAILDFENEWARAYALPALDPQLTGELDTEDLAAAKVIREETKRGLAAVQVIKDEEDRVRALLALAPQLTDELVEEGITAALTIKDEGLRAVLLATLALQVPNNSEQQGGYHNTRNALRDHFWNNLQKGQRSAVLGFCSNATLFGPPGMNDQAVGDVVKAVMDVGRWWP